MNSDAFVLPTLVWEWQLEKMFSWMWFPLPLFASYKSTIVRVTVSVQTAGGEHANIGHCVCVCGEKKDAVIGFLCFCLCCSFIVLIINGTLSCAPISIRTNTSRWQRTTVPRNTQRYLEQFMLQWQFDMHFALEDHLYWIVILVSVYREFTV